jgi:hypothetical protein
MMHRGIEKLVLHCPASGATSNVAIPVLAAWLQTQPTQDVRAHQYAALVAHIQSTEEKHLATWRQLGLSPMAQERLWTAIGMIKAHGPPQTLPVRAGTVVTVLSPAEDPPAREGTSEHHRREKYIAVKCCVLSVGYDATGAAIAHAAPLPREAQTEPALLAWRTNSAFPGSCPRGAEQMGRMRSFNVPLSALRPLTSQLLGFECPLCKQTFVPDLGGVCGTARLPGDEDKEDENIALDDALMRKAAKRFTDHVGLNLEAKRLP